MKGWQLSQLRLVRSAQSQDEAFVALLPEVQALGFEYCSFGMKSPVPLAAPRVVWCSNYPSAWQARYVEQGYLNSDPIVQRGLMSDEAFLWTDELFASNPQLYAEAQSFGLRYAWCQPRRDMRGMTSLFSVVRGGPALEAAELAAKIERLQWLSYLCHEAMAKVWVKELQGDLELGLSERELEVLRWTCDGKTSSETAQIMGVAEATVNFHTRNACSKLGASNKTAAAVRAAVLGLFH